MKFWLALAMALFAGPAFATSDNFARCGDRLDGAPAWTDSVSNCILRRAGEKTLWRASLPSHVRQHIRFTYSDGHYNSARVINFMERADGRGIIRLKTIRRDKTDRLTISLGKRRRVAPADVAMIDQLGSSSGNWEPAIGTWDADIEDEDGQSIVFIDCPVLTMERVTLSGYSRSEVSIPCNQPTKLMPFVRFVIKLAGVSPSDWEID